MAKKKKTAKKKRKKAAPKKTTKKKVVKKKQSKKKAAPKTKAIVKAEVIGEFNQCQFCGQSFRTQPLFEDHLYEKHGGMTLREYRKFHPRSKKPFHVSETLVSTDEVYRAMVHMAKFGKYPDYFDASQPIDLTKGDPNIIKAFTNVMMKVQMERATGPMVYHLAAQQREFTIEAAMTDSPTKLEEKSKRAAGIMSRVIEEMHRLVDLQKKASGLTPDIPGTDTGRGFVTAATIEGSDSEESVKESNRVRRQLTAVTSEFHGMVQSFILEGSEHGARPPSEDDQIKEITIEKAKPEGNGGKKPLDTEEDV